MTKGREDHPRPFAFRTSDDSAGSAAVDVVRVLLLPREERAQLLAGRLDRVGGALLAQGEELGGTGILVLKWGAIRIALKWMSSMARSCQHDRGHSPVDGR
jgi:hypothetical protein